MLWGGGRPSVLWCFVGCCCDVLNSKAPSDILVCTVSGPASGELSYDSMMGPGLPGGGTLSKQYYSLSKPGDLGAIPPGQECQTLLSEGGMALRERLQRLSTGTGSIAPFPLIQAGCPAPPPFRPLASFHMVPVCMR